MVAERVDASVLAAAWAEAGALLPGWSMFEQMSDAGWTAAEVSRLRRIAAEGTARPEPWTVRDRAVELCWLVAALTQAGVDWPRGEALSWAGVVLGSPDYAEEPGEGLRLLAAIPSLADWRNVTGGALAWAAGLTPGEAENWVGSGRVTEADLRVLAGLRGFQIPGAAARITTR